MKSFRIIGIGILVIFVIIVVIFLVMSYVSSTPMSKQDAVIHLEQYFQKKSKKRKKFFWNSSTSCFGKEWSEFFFRGWKYEEE
jgi:hypothetical protein